MYTLFYYPQSASLAPHILLEMIGEPYQLELVDMKKNVHHSSSFMKISPAAQVPALVDDKFTLFDSAAISQYLALKHKDKSLLPSSFEAQATCLQWLHYMSSTLQNDWLIYAYPERHTQSALMYDDLIRTQQTRLDASFKVIDNMLKDKHYLLSDQFTICDSYLYMICARAKQYLERSAAFKNLKGYIKQLNNVPEIAKAVDATTP
ncbi:glutathione S-transferase family protein (plasmid) [Pseudoalteromonas sp. T1lg65]|uniref:glutathione S-transferase family protein n=1 Tax=Pseudoalteromonas sp. T1lg65 TaxID=2077101 RepID=UPI003F7AD8A6